MARRSKFAGPGVFDVVELKEMLGYDPSSPTPPADFPEFGEDIEVDRCCPRCSYRWSSGGEGTDPLAEEA